MPAMDNPYRARKRRTAPAAVAARPKRSSVAPMAKQYAARARRMSQKMRASY